MFAEKLDNRKHSDVVYPQKSKLQIVFQKQEPEDKIILRDGRSINQDMFNVLLYPGFTVQNIITCSPLVNSVEIPVTFQKPSLLLF